VGPAYFTGNSHSHEWLHDELWILFEPGKKGAQIRLSGGERDGANFDGSIERMADGSIGTDDEIAAELGPTPHRDAHRVSGAQHYRVRSCRGRLGDHDSGQGRVCKYAAPKCQQQVSHFLTWGVEGWRHRVDGLA
jgi:hypothetical protein